MEVDFNASIRRKGSKDAKPYVPLMIDIRRAERRRLAVKSIAAIALISISTIVFISLHITETARASDPTPVNPPGEIPAIVVDETGKVYEVFTPREGGTIVGDEFSFEALPGDVPSALLVAVRMTKDSPASNVGMTHHRYTIGGHYYVIGAVDGRGKPFKTPFTFRKPAMACVPLPSGYLANIDTVRLIATDPEVGSQTVLTSTSRLGRSGLQMCGYVGTVPTTVVVGIEGSPGPLPPTPVVEVQIVELPVTGGAAIATKSLAIAFLAGFALLGLAWAVARARNRRAKRLGQGSLT